MTVEPEAKGFIDKIEQWDFKLLLKLYQSDFSRRTKTFAKAFSFLGNGIFWMIIWLGMAGYAYLFTKDYFLVFLFAGGFDQSFILYAIIRHIVVARNRPFITLQDHGIIKHDTLIAENKSFPSGHVTFFLFFGTIFAFYFQSWIILFVFFGLDIIMAVTRLVLGVHFPSDVIAGFAFGALFSFLYLGLTYPYWIWFYELLGDMWSMIKLFFTSLL